MATTYRYDTSDYNISSSSTNSTSISSSVTGNYFRRSRSNSGGGACNESKRHDNEEKAIFHGMKSAFRVSREYDGSEYGTPIPCYETAARIAANVAIAYLKTTGQEYTREESHEYIEENFSRTMGFTERFFGTKKSLSQLVGEKQLEDAIKQAWEQIDTKENHYDGARTALAAAETFLGEELEV